MHYRRMGLRAAATGGGLKTTLRRFQPPATVEDETVPAITTDVMMQATRRSDDVQISTVAVAASIHEHPQEEQPPLTAAEPTFSGQPEGEEYQHTITNPAEVLCGVGSMRKFTLKRPREENQDSRGAGIVTTASDGSLAGASAISLPPQTTTTIALYDKNQTLFDEEDDDDDVHPLQRLNGGEDYLTVAAATSMTAATVDEEARRLMLEQEEDLRRDVDMAFTQRSHSADSITLSQQQHQQQHHPPPLQLTPSPAEPSYYGLPLSVERMYRSRGVTKLYDWQHEVLSRVDVLKGHNFVYSLPTSGGKTLVAEVLLMRSVLCRNKSAMLVLPFVSIAEEKTIGLDSFGVALGFPVEGYYGTNGRFPVSSVPGIFVCTIEKANSLFNNLCEEGRQTEIGCIVVDELHMVGEPRRGATLELLLTKVLTASPDETQIVGMSATVPNLPTLARWLRASCFVCDFRPVPLKQYSVCDGVVLENGVTNVRNLPSSNEHEALLYLVSEEPDASVLVFCATRQSTVDTAKQIVKGLVRLLQWPRRPHTESTLEELRQLGHDDPATAASGTSSLACFKELIPYGVAFHHGGLLMEERQLIERAYRSKRISILCCTSTLAAGVNLPARRVVFRTPYVARDFLTKSRYLQMCGRAGRAGLDAFGESFLILNRKDREQGHALMLQATEDSKSAMTMSMPLTVNPVQQQQQNKNTEAEPHVFARALLECAGVKIFSTIEAAIGFAKNLLVFVESVADEEERQQKGEDVSPPAPPLPSGTTSCDGVMTSPFTEHFEDMVQEALLELEHCRLITLFPPQQQQQYDHQQSLAEDSDQRSRTTAITGCDGDRDDDGPPVQASRSRPGKPLDYMVAATPFGASAVRSCFGIDEALMIRDELTILQETGLILSDDLHICYFLTPIREVIDCDWGCYSRILSRMNDARQRIAESLGVNEYYVERCAQGMISLSHSPALVNGSPSIPHLLSDPQRRELFTTRRFYVALMLCDLLNETPFHVVEAKYRANRGQLQSLLKSASMFSSSMTNFCAAMGWHSLEALLASFVKRLGFGVKPDIVPLMEIKGVQAGRARALWCAGFKDPASLAAAMPNDVVERVKAANPKDNKAVKFFTIKSAVAVVREATRLVQHQIREKQGEVMELTARSTQHVGFKSASTTTQVRLR